MAVYGTNQCGIPYESVEETFWSTLGYNLLETCVKNHASTLVTSQSYYDDVIVTTISIRFIRPNGLEERG